MTPLSRTTTGSVTTSPWRGSLPLDVELGASSRRAWDRSPRVPLGGRGVCPPCQRGPLSTGRLREDSCGGSTEGDSARPPVPRGRRRAERTGQAWRLPQPVVGRHRSPAPSPAHLSEPRAQGPAPLGPDSRAKSPFTWTGSPRPTSAACSTRRRIADCQRRPSNTSTPCFGWLSSRPSATTSSSGT